MTITRRALTFVLLSLAFAGMLFPPEVLADQGRRVVFPRGSDSVTLAGRLPQRSGDYYYYLVRARKGQTLSVDLQSEAPGAHIAIFETKKLGPDEDTLLSPSENAREWSADLPISSDYSIQVYDGEDSGSRGKGTPYTITISIR